MGAKNTDEMLNCRKKMSEEELKEEMEKVVEDLKGGMSKPAAADNIGSSSVKAATLNMITQMSFRVITFLLNAFVLRHINRDVMGLINVRLTLLDDTIIFLSREGFRLACIGHKGKDGWEGALNLMWLCVPLSVVWSTVLGWVWLNLLPSPPEELQSQYVSGVYMVAFSVVIQMFAEVPWLVGQIFLYVRLRVVMDFVWMLTRVLFLVYAVIFHPNNVVEVWSFGHLMAGILFVAGYYLAFSLIFKYGNAHSSCEHCSALPFTSVSQLLPTFKNGAFPINNEYRRVAVSFMGQGVMKQVLTEGERYLMTFLDLLTLSQQGIYDVVSNLGSLAARFVFRPVEESCYFFFSQQWKRGVAWSDQDPDHLDKVRQGLARILRLMLLTGLVILVFGFSYSDLLLRLYGGANLAGDGGTALLRAQCLLVAFLAVNGVTECFARSVMTDVEINNFNKKLVFLSISYLGLTWMLTSLIGPVGLVLANCVNMTIRIFFSVQIIQKAFEGAEPSPIHGLNPDNDILFILLCTGTCCQLSELYLYFWFPVVHFLLGAVLFLVVLVSIVVKEDFILAFIVSKYRTMFPKEKLN